MSELKPCPFCGGNPFKYYSGSDGNGIFLQIVCEKCKAETDRIKIGVIKATANDEISVSAWNRRAQPANNPLTLEQLREMDNEKVFVILDDVCIPALIACNTEDCSSEDEDDVVYLTNNLGGRSTYEDMLDMGAKFYRHPPEGSENE